MKTRRRQIHTKAFEGDLGDIDAAEVNQRDSHGATPLMYAVGSGQLPTALALIQAGADVDAAADSGYTALMRAAASIKRTDFVRLLLDAGADRDREDSCGETALDGALANSHTAELRCCNRTMLQRSWKKVIRKALRRMRALHQWPQATM